MVGVGGNVEPSPSNNKVTSGRKTRGYIAPERVEADKSTTGGSTMSGRIGSLGRRYRTGIAVLTLLVTLALALPAVASACGEGGEDTGPLIHLAQVTPASLTSAGGTGVVTTEVEDDCGVQVYAEISSTEGAYWSFQLLPFENINSNSVVYHGEFQILPNYQEWPVSYQVTISVEDTNGAFEQAYAGEVEVAGLPPFDEAPYVSEASVGPPVLGSAGGQVKIGADASDTRGLGNVFAIVTLPDETQKEVPLEGVNWLHFEGRFKAPANLGATRQEYSVIVYAEDDIGQQSWESAGGFAVAPLTGLLNAWTSVGSYFRDVPIGDTATRLVVVRNRGGPRTQPVKASITTSGAAFSLQEAVGRKIDFTLGPEERRVFAVDFSPVSQGFKVGSAIVSREDGAQPDISVRLTGQAVKPPAD
jgi:hypothetical protein